MMNVQEPQQMPMLRCCRLLYQTHECAHLSWSPTRILRIVNIISGYLSGVVEVIIARKRWLQRLKLKRDYVTP